MWYILTYILNAFGWISKVHRRRCVASIKVILYIIYGITSNSNMFMHPSVHVVNIVLKINGY